MVRHPSLHAPSPNCNLSFSYSVLLPPEALPTLRRKLIRRLMDEIRLDELNTECPLCGGLVPFWGDTCTVCGHVSHPPHRLRMMGILYLVLGVGLTGGIAYLMAVIAQIMRHSGDPHATTRFNGTPSQAMMIFGVLTVPLLIGLTLVVTGLWQIRFGRRNLKLVRVAFFWFYFLTGTILLFQGTTLVRLLTHR